MEPRDSRYGERDRLRYDPRLGDRSRPGDLEAGERCLDGRSTLVFLGLTSDLVALSESDSTISPSDDKDAERDDMFAVADCRSFNSSGIYWSAPIRVLAFVTDMRRGFGKKPNR